MAERRSGPKRSLLVQERSRDTRRGIVRAALELWAQRGYETGIDETTAEEIAARAGISKATFYFHFARKEDILLEAGWLTARVIYEDALRELEANRTVDAALSELMARIGRRVEKAPRTAVRRMLRAQNSGSVCVQPDEEERFGFDHAFSIVFARAQETGDLPMSVTARSLALMLSSLVMDAIRDWALADPAEPPVDLSAVLRERAALMLAGARHLPMAESGLR
ncbi:TetR/AcrR family transcriptional regulator [Frankia sp. CNm7]|uniref:TetR/AcrR family transcriptional regulator n=1 Tax=Frankia nepalensis TaxID=1836974 RepID=A0A937RIP0_9ACTN|nr:TetR/AcrR family transcriptional regulator [Frankia nepalensis]MBL7495845.1 TetR/AcrR family transcriptional regulator [Frankia nepalensis]MBL7509921.1 TetR/AcrR family transcriptional regulator [Frankia nepalensis]MBL7523698.1 TetR/AcrR family transcriptional regulator [Frankia nepalensis]MBL7629680.1 TetR/AcrR family transcriptional regulator [Frankia nepalensis]